MNHAQFPKNNQNKHVRGTTNASWKQNIYTLYVYDTKKGRAQKTSETN